MIRTIVGPDLFRKGMDLYFERHDGDAATIEDFIKVFADVSGQDFSQFSLWYDQSGTPKVEASFDFNAAKETFTIEFAQSLAPTPGQPTKKPMHIPIAFGLLGADGKDIQPSSVEWRCSRWCDPSSSGLGNHCLSWHQGTPGPSLLRGFSAPINLVSPLDAEDRIFLALNDSDPVARWQALTGIFTQVLLDGAKRVRGGYEPETDGRIIELAGRVASDETLDAAFRALCLTLPTESDIAREMGHNVDPDAIRASRDHLIAAIVSAYSGDFASLYASLQQATFSPDAVSAGKRALRNVLLDYLSLYENSPARAAQQFADGDNMTDRAAALSILVHRFGDSHEAQGALASFEKRFGDDGLVMDKWFIVQATRPGEKRLMPSAHSPSTSCFHSIIRTACAH